MKNTLTMLLLFVTTFIFAQNDTINQLNDVTIYGIRSKNISQETICKEDLQKYNSSNEISTVLNKTPNVTLSSDNGTPFGYTYFRLRGLDQTKVNMTLNGVPLNEPEDQGVFFSNYPNFLENIQSLQVQRGVGTSSNGTSSFAGSINFNSPDGFDKEGNVKYTLGSFNTHKLSATYRTGLSSKKFAFYTNVSNYKTDGYRYKSGGDGMSIFVSGGYFGDNNKVKITAFSGRSRNDMAWLPVAESDINLNRKTNYNDTNAPDDFKQSFIQLEYGTKVATNVKLNSSVFYNRLDGAYDYAMDGTQNTFLKSNFLGVVNNLNYKVNNTKIDFGLSANTYTRFHNYFDSSFNNKGVKNDVSTYIKISQQLDNLTLTLDLQERFVNFNYYGNTQLPDGKIKWNFFNPKFAVNYKFNNSTNLYAGVGQAYREPTRTNMFMGNDFLVDGFFNNVQPEKVIDYEFGINHNSKKVYLQANLFYMDFKNEILPSGGAAPNAVGNSVSAPSSYRKGIEGVLKYKILEEVTFKYNQSITFTNFSNVSYDGGFIESGNAILTPKNIINIGLEYTKNGFMFEVNTKTQSSSYLDLSNDYSIGGFTTINSNIGYETKRYSILVTVNNLTSKKYYTNGSMIDRNFAPSTERQLFTNPLINGFLTLKYKF